MSPPARSLLALAAAALLRAACAEDVGIDVQADGEIARRHGDDTNHCTFVEDGGPGLIPIYWHKHIVEKSSTVAVEKPCPTYTHVVGKYIKVCDPVGPPPDVILVDGGKRARIVCKWGSAGLCPKGLDMDVLQFCGYF